MLRLSAATSSAGVHAWRFFRASGLDRARLETADDFRNLASLDQKRWVALGCPTHGLNLDERTLAPVLDGTGWAVNGRLKINVPLGAALTHQARLPANARRTLKDPYEEQICRPTSALDDCVSDLRRAGCSSVELARPLVVAGDWRSSTRPCSPGCTRNSSFAGDPARAGTRRTLRPKTTLNL